MLVPAPAWTEHDGPEREHAPLEQEALSVQNVLVREAMQRGLLKEKYTESALVATTLWAGIHGAVLIEIAMTPEVRALLGEIQHAQGCLPGRFPET